MKKTEAIKSMTDYIIRELSEDTETLIKVVMIVSTC